MNKKDKAKLVQFLTKARTKTYAGNKGKVRPVFSGSHQLEHKEGKWLYRDVYYSGNGIFMGLEAVYYGQNPIWSMSYYGNFKKMTEKEADSVLRQALLDKWQETRLWKKVEWKKGDYKYVCNQDFKGSIKELAGMEEIFKKGKQVYSFFYAGGIVG